MKAPVTHTRTFRKSQLHITLPRIHQQVHSHRTSSQLLLQRLQTRGVRTYHRTIPNIPIRLNSKTQQQQLAFNTRQVIPVEWQYTLNQYWHRFQWIPHSVGNIWQHYWTNFILTTGVHYCHIWYIGCIPPDTNQALATELPVSNMVRTRSHWCSSYVWSGIKHRSVQFNCQCASSHLWENRLLAPQKMGQWLLNHQACPRKMVRRRLHGTDMSHWHTLEQGEDKVLCNSPKVHKFLVGPQRKVCKLASGEIRSGIMHSQNVVRTRLKDISQGSSQYPWQTHTHFQHILTNLPILTIN